MNTRMNITPGRRDRIIKFLYLAVIKKRFHQNYGFYVENKTAHPFQTPFATFISAGGDRSFVNPSQAQD